MKPDSSNSSHIDGNDWENHLVIRFPPEVASKIRQFVEQDSHQSGNQRLSINFDNNLRTGTVQFDQNMMRFTVYDLPCVIEVMKTLDNKNIYKVVDLSQMIAVDMPGIEYKAEKKRSENLEERGDSRQGKYQWPHGLCPPLKNVRRKRFRKVKKKKYMDVADVERELKRLLRSDLEAVSVRWEVVSAAEVEETEAMQTDEEKEQMEEEAASQAAFEYGLSLSESEDEQNNF